MIEERYGNLFEMYERITDENPYVVPMRIFPAVHYTMGGLWVDYDLMSNVPGLFVLGEANFADQGANRLGASALMQGLADGYFVLPNTIGGYLAPLLGEAPVPVDDPAFKEVGARRRRAGAQDAVGQRQPLGIRRKFCDQTEDDRHRPKRDRHPDRSDQQERPAADLVHQGDRDQRGERCWSPT